MDVIAPGNRLGEPALVFFALAFGIPWAGWLSLTLFDVRQPWLVQTLFFTGDACSIAGLVAAYSASGRAGVIGLLQSAVRFKAPVAWWIYALCLPLLIQIVVRGAYGMMNGGIGRVEAASVAAFVSPQILFMLLTGPLGEEFGWRGFLLPQLLRTHTALKASLILGAVWGIWHLPLYYTAWLATPWKAPEFLLVVLCYTFMLTALYIGSRGNLLLCIVMHWMFNASRQIGKSMFPDVSDKGMDFAVLQLAVFAVVAGLAIVFAKSRQDTELAAGSSI